jgi:hypothetical protein
MNYVRGIAPAVMGIFIREDAACRLFRFAAYRLLECLAIFDAHQVIENRVDGSAEIIQAAAQDVQPFV